MYEDTWYSVAADSRSNVDDGDARQSRRKSLLAQTQETNGHLETQQIVKDVSTIAPKHGPPRAHVVRGFKSTGNLSRCLEQHVSRCEGEATKDNEHAQHVNDKTMQPKSFEHLHSDLLDASEEAFQNQLLLTEEHVNGLIQDTDLALSLLAGITNAFRSVNAESGAFQAQCEDLLAEHKRIRGLTDEIGDDLQYYAYLEPLTRRLNTPGAARLVHSDGFLEMLDNLNGCISFMNKHPSYRDSMTYKNRYTVLLNKALNFVETSVVSALKDTSDEVYNRLNAKDQTETTEYILLYGKFETANDQLGPVVKRILTTDQFAFGQDDDTGDHASYGPEYHRLYTNLLEAYVRSREPIAPLILKRLRTFAPKSITMNDAEFKTFARRCIQWVFDMCRNEISLVEKYFKNGPLMTSYSSELGNWNVPTNYLKRLEQICLSHVTTVNSFLTPYLNKSDLPRLCDLVNWLETTYMGGADDDEVIAEHDGHILAAQALLNEHLWPLLDQQFVNAAKDLEYFRPNTEHLQITKRPRTGSAGVPTADPKTTNIEQVGLANQSHLDRAYPTVKTAIDLMVRYNDSVFDRLSKGDVVYEIVHQTTISLQKAATTIKRTSSTMDAQIFLIRNLMLIENLFMTHEMPESIRQATELDFSPIWNTLHELRESNQTLNPLAYVHPLVKGNLVPAVRDQLLDARKEMEKVLVQQITGFTKTWQSRLKAPTVGKKNNVTADDELRQLLEAVFDDETTRNALLRMIYSQDTEA